MKMEYKNILPHFNNIPQNSRSILRYFTEGNKIILFIPGIILLNLVIIPPTSALEYRSTEQIEFNINPTVSITISGGDLSIPSLAPGDSKDSNIITVTASSNAMNGYSLSSTVGDSTNASTELRKGGTDTTYKFTNLTTNKPSLSDFDSNTNTWGYSYCNTSSDCTNNTNWISGDITGTPTTGYNGLPIYITESPITLINSSTATTNSIQFKIGARSTTTLVAGEYTNIINFIGLARPNPTYITLDQATYMQDDFSCVATPVGTVKKLIDNRDGQEYLVARAMDGKCWMAENLDLEGGTALSASDTDVASTYIESFATSNNLIKEGNAIVLPKSNTGFNTDNYSYVYNSNNPTSNCATPGCYSYYSWDAATLGSGRSITTNNTDAPYSICPIGWHLPNTRSSTDSNSDFRNLMIALGGSNIIETYNSTTTPTGTEIFNHLSSTPLNFLRAGGYVANTLHNGGSYGHYWSATSQSSTNARILYFGSTNVYSASDGNRKNGYSVRCLKSS